MQYSGMSVAIVCRTLLRRRAVSGQWLRVAALLSIAATLWSADIKGTITVKQRLTRPSVTASVSVYERGPVVELGKDADPDPLADERARVVIWVAGHPIGATTGGSGASMRQVNRRFDPDIVAISAGAS